MQQRVTEAAAERKLRIRHEEEADKAAAQVKRLKERQETLMAHSATQNLSTREVALTDERDKLMVRFRSCKGVYRTAIPVKRGMYGREGKSQVWVLTRQKLLRCSTCEQNFKGQMIVKCGHSEFIVAIAAPMAIRQRADRLQHFANPVSTSVSRRVNGNVRRVVWAFQRKRCRPCFGNKHCRSKSRSIPDTFIHPSPLSSIA